MATSYAYNFQNFNTGDLILAAYRRLGVKNAEVTGEDILNARTELNLIFSHWAAKHFNLFCMEQDLLQITPGQTTYLLPSSTVKITDAALISLNRQLSGVASSSSGVAANAFDGDPTTSCVQTDPNGWIEYDYNSPTLPQGIQYIGILTPVNLYLSLQVQYAIAAGVWQTIMTIPPQQFNAFEPLWFVLPFQQTAPFWRIIETGGATLDIAELYFDVPGNSFQLMTPSPREILFAFPPQNTIGPDSTSGAFTYWMNRIPQPTVGLYGLPSVDYSHFIYWRQRQMQDVNLTMTNSQDMTQRFFQSAVYELATVLSYQKDISRLPALDPISRETYAQAAGSDKDFSKINISPYNLGRN